MTTIAIELTDPGVLAVADNDLVVGPSPGYALLVGNSLLVGTEAQAIARLKPRWVDDRFWDRIDSSPMPRPFPRSLSRADVAHTHLSQFWQMVQTQLSPHTEVTAVLLVVPGSFNVEQLGLILGIARACQIPVTGLVDAAVAAVSQVPVAPRVLHLDVLLHRVVWTELEYEAELARRRVEILEGHGLAAFRDVWAKYIAKILVRQTRFDPLHHGQAEQSLFDRLPLWLEELTENSRVEVNLESGGKEHSIELSSENIDTATGSLLKAVVEIGRSLAAQGETPVVMVSSRASTLPGLVTGLSRLPNQRIDCLREQSAARGGLANKAHVDSPGPELTLVNRLPADLGVLLTTADRVAQAKQTVHELPANPPTHILLAGIAYSIQAEPLWLGSAAAADERCLLVSDPMPGLSRRHCAVLRRDGKVIVEDHSSYGTYLGGRRIEQSAEARVGDRLRLGSPGVELEMILVESDV